MAFIAAGIAGIAEAIAAAVAAGEAGAAVAGAAEAAVGVGEAVAGAAEVGAGAAEAGEVIAAGVEAGEAGEAIAEAGEAGEAISTATKTSETSEALTRGAEGSTRGALTRGALTRGALTTTEALESDMETVTLEGLEKTTIPRTGLEVSTVGEPIQPVGQGGFAEEFAFEEPDDFFAEEVDDEIIQQEERTIKQGLKNMSFDEFKDVAQTIADEDVTNLIDTEELVAPEEAQEVFDPLEDITEFLDGKDIDIPEPTGEPITVDEFNQFLDRREAILNTPAEPSFANPADFPELGTGRGAINMPTQEMIDQIPSLEEIEVQDAVNDFITGITDPPASQTFSDGLRSLNYFNNANIVKAGALTVGTGALLSLPIAKALQVKSKVPITQTQLMAYPLPASTTPTQTKLLVDQISKGHMANSYSLVGGGSIPSSSFQPSVNTRINGLDALSMVTAPSNVMDSSYYKTMAVGRQKTQKLAKEALNDVSSSADSKKAADKDLKDLEKEMDPCAKPKPKPKSPKQKKEDKKKREKKKREEAKCELNKKVIKAVDNVGMGKGKAKNAIKKISDVMKVAQNIKGGLKKLSSGTKNKQILKDVKNINDEIKKVEKMANINLKSKNADKIIKQAEKAKDIVGEARRIEKKIRDLKMSSSLKDAAKKLLINAKKIKENVKTASKIASDAIEIIDI